MGVVQDLGQTNDSNLTGTQRQSFNHAMKNAANLLISNRPGRLFDLPTAPLPLDLYIA
jgi:hypothetical protein